MHKLFLVAIVALSLAVTGCSTFCNAVCGDSEPIDLSLAQEAHENAETLNDTVNYMADVLDGKRENDWDEDESRAHRAHAQANLAVAKEVLSNAQKANPPEQ